MYIQLHFADLPFIKIILCDHFIGIQLISIFVFKFRSVNFSNVGMCIHLLFTEFPFIWPFFAIHVAIHVFIIRSINFSNCFSKNYLSFRYIDYIHCSHCIAIQPIAIYMFKFRSYVDTVVFHRVTFHFYW